MKSNTEFNNGINNWDSLTVLPTNTPFAAGNNMGQVAFPAGMGFIPYNSDGGVSYVDLGNTRLLYQAFYKCAPLAAIVNNLSEAFVAGKFEVLNRTTGNYARGKNKEWERLLQRPNPMQSRKHFFKQLYSNVIIAGWCFCLKSYASGFKDMPYQLFVLPSENLTFERKIIYGLPDSYKNLGDIYRIYFTANGERTELNWEDLMYFTDSTLTNPITMMPHSRMTALRYPISQVIALYEAKATLVQKHGALGILSNQGKDQLGHIPITPEERRKVEQQFYTNYGLARGQSQVIITTADLHWQQMAMNVKDLMLHEDMLSSVKDICEAYGYPFPLSAHSDQSTFNNVNTADTLLYQNTVIPASEDLIDEQLNEQLNTYDQNIEIVMNYNDLPALQATNKAKGEGKKALNEAYQLEWDAGIITRNQWLKAIGRDEVMGNEAFDKYKFELTEEQVKTITDGSTTPKN